MRPSTWSSPPSRLSLPMCRLSPVTMSVPADLVFVEAVDVVHAGDDQALAPVELDAVGGSGGKGIVRHSGTS